MPIRIAGPGQLTVGASRLRAEGYESGRSCLIPVLVFFGGFAALVAMFVVAGGPDLLFRILAVGLALGFVGWVTSRAGEHDDDTPRSLDVPLECVESVDLASGWLSDETTVRIGIEDHDPEGMLHFQPDDMPPPELVQRLRRAAGLDDR